MGPIERNQEIVMVADELPRTPHAISRPYSIRAFADGDVAAWTAIQSAVDQYNEITTGLFRAAFGIGRDPHAQRILIACDGAGAPVGTAAACVGDGDRARALADDGRPLRHAPPVGFVR